MEMNDITRRRILSSCATATAGLGFSGYAAAEQEQNGENKRKTVHHGQLSKTGKKAFNRAKRQGMYKIGLNCDHPRKLLSATHVEYGGQAYALNPSLGMQSEFGLDISAATSSESGSETSMRYRDLSEQGKRMFDRARKNGSAPTQKSFPSEFLSNPKVEWEGRLYDIGLHHRDAGYTMINPQKQS